MLPQNLPYGEVIPHKLALTSTHLILVNHENVQTVDLETLSLDAELSLETGESEDVLAPVNTLATSPDGTIVAVGNLNNLISVCDLSAFVSTLDYLPSKNS